jgi:hypothetical protein
MKSSLLSAWASDLSEKERNEGFADEEERN